MIRESIRAWWFGKPRPFPIKPVTSQSILSPAVKTLRHHWKGKNTMSTISSPVNLEPALAHVAAKMIADREALINMLNANIRDFAEQNRLLAEYQGCVRLIDIVTVQNEKPPAPQDVPLPSANQRLGLSVVYDAMKQVDRDEAFEALMKEVETERGAVR